MSHRVTFLLPLGERHNYRSVHWAFCITLCFAGSKHQFSISSLPLFRIFQFSNFQTSCGAWRVYCISGCPQSFQQVSTRLPQLLAGLLDVATVVAQVSSTPVIVSHSSRDAVTQREEALQRWSRFSTCAVKAYMNFHAEPPKLKVEVSSAMADMADQSLNIYHQAGCVYGHNWTQVHHGLASGIRWKSRY